MRAATAPADLSTTICTSDLDLQWPLPTHVGDSAGIDVYDVRPPYANADRPVILVPGWGGTPEMYRSNILILARLGRRTLAIKAPDGCEYPLPLQCWNSTSTAQLKRTGALMKALDVKQIQVADAVGHSEGCLDIAFAAYLFPQRFRNFVLIDPAGFAGHDRAWRLAARFLTDAVGSYFDSISDAKLRRPLFRATREIAHSFLQNPIRSAREIGSMSTLRGPDLLRQIRRTGIRSSIIHGVGDGTFPMDRVQGAVKSDMVDGFFSVKGRHGQFQLEPDAYTRLAHFALTAMDSKNGV
jgi:pimeloyl-ACP methyl ester carboxylesterase